jgi:hypothetical protein
MSTTANTPTVLAANKAVVQRFFSAFNDQTPDVFDEIISPEYVDYGHEPRVADRRELATTTTAPLALSARSSTSLTT